MAERCAFAVNGVSGVVARRRLIQCRSDQRLARSVGSANRPVRPVTPRIVGSRASVKNARRRHHSGWTACAADGIATTTALSSQAAYMVSTLVGALEREAHSVPPTPRAALRRIASQLQAGVAATPAISPDGEYSSTGADSTDPVVPSLALTLVARHDRTTPPPPLFTHASLPTLLLEAVQVLCAGGRGHIARVHFLSPDALEITVRPHWPGGWTAPVQVDDLQRQLRQRLERHAVASVALQLDDTSRRLKRLAVFDLDSTLILNESIDELVAYAGVSRSVVSHITERAMLGELDFAEALRQRAALLRGVSAADAWQAVMPRLQLAPGARRLVRALKALGARVVIASGGFVPLAESVRRRIGADAVYANELEVDGHTGRFTGHVLGDVVDAPVKERVLVQEWQALQAAVGNRVDASKVPAVLCDTLAVGDGANDLRMLSRASLAVAYRAKPIVQRQAQVCIEYPRLDAILWLLGMTEEEIARWAPDAEEERVESA